MVTLFDTGILQKFDFLFPFLLVLLLVYVVLIKTKTFEERKAIAAMIAFIFAIMTLTSRIAIKMINKMAPWFILLIVFGLFILIVYQAMGISEKKIGEVLTSEEHGPAFFWWIIALVVLIGLGSLITVFSEEKGFLSLKGEGIDDEETSLWTALLHPKMLGLILLFLIAYFTIQKMTSSR